MKVCPNSKDLLSGSPPPFLKFNDLPVDQVASFFASLWGEGGLVWWCVVWSGSALLSHTLLWIPFCLSCFRHTEASSPQSSSRGNGFKESTVPWMWFDWISLSLCNQAPNRWSVEHCCFNLKGINSPSDWVNCPRRTTFHWFFPAENIYQILVTCDSWLTFGYSDKRIKKWKN